MSVFELARIMGTSVRMIERHYGALLNGAGAEIAGRLDALDAARQRRNAEANGGRKRNFEPDDQLCARRRFLPGRRGARSPNPARAHSDGDDDEHDHADVPYRAVVEEIDDQQRERRRGRRGE